MRTTQPIDPQTGRPLATYGLDVAAKFTPLTVASFTAKYGYAPDPFNYGKPIKRWREDAAKPLEPNIPAREFFIYKVATGASGTFQPDKDGFVEPIDTGMSASEAWAVNIPPDIGLGTIPGTTSTSEVRMPLDLLPNERLQKQPWGGGLQIRRVDVPSDPPSGGILPGSFTESDRVTLYKIAGKLGL